MLKKNFKTSAYVQYLYFKHSKFPKHMWSSEKKEEQNMWNNNTFVVPLKQVHVP